MVPAFATPRYAATLLTFASDARVLIAAALQFSAEPVCARHVAVQDSFTTPKYHSIACGATSLYCSSTALV
eukprot:CAMPEP_0184716864 /NCGR_PEP_ID=MMETSP0314-20130426/6497_1 /TAXON_ID=38298 /ORGANISM="Rhodella maculata, Strain CCMP 736" /LENGTH=70 /DNA_ID=CAMNT_0027180349 /DNA_START=444 /DNA_END=653 /DNA_ORIENTATION=+